jgi:hypothetical protein
MEIYKHKSRYYLYRKGGQLLLVTKSRRVCEHYLAVGEFYIKTKEEEV